MITATSALNAFFIGVGITLLVYGGVILADVALEIIEGGNRG